MVVTSPVPSPVHGPVQSPESRFCTNPRAWQHYYCACARARGDSDLRAWACLLASAVLATRVYSPSAREKQASITVQFTGNLILTRLTLGEYTRAPDRVLSSARYSTHERTGKHSLALRLNTARRVVCYAGQAQAQLFLIRALQGYRRTPCKR